MPYKDLRDFIVKLEEEGEVQQIDQEVDWNMEVGAIMRRGGELKSPAPFFQKIKGYPPGYRILGSPLATFRRLAIAMELPPDTSYTQIMDTYDERRRHPIKPNLVSDGPCKENIHLGNDIDLLEFPAPIFHPGDGGRYISTFHLIATRDPDSNWVNWGMYRQMVLSKDTLGALVNPIQHIGRIFHKYEARDKPMEFAVAIGTEPITAFVSASQSPEGVSEMDVIGGVRREPLEVIKCETVDLVVPATSEIVFEGKVFPHERADEGPFGEWTGYVSSPRSPKPVFRVEAITHRNEPILTSSCPGIPLSDSDIIQAIDNGVEARSALRDAGLPITGVYIPPESSELMCVISTKTPYPNIAAQIASCLWGTKRVTVLTKVIVVNDDVDVNNMEEVIHALATKCHPVRGITIFPHLPSVPLIPYLSPEEKKNRSGANILFDCTWPLDWPSEYAGPRVSFREMYPETIKEKVLENWNRYGFKN